jgi:hypothetical protein
MDVDVEVSSVCVVASIRDLAYVIPLFGNLPCEVNLTISYLPLGRELFADDGVTFTQPMLPTFPGAWTGQQISLPPFFGPYGTIIV